jgi:deoxyribodipyrimidine photo-lyase
LDQITAEEHRLTTIVWFRQDLRIADNPALAAAAARGPVVAIFIMDPTGPSRRIGGAGKWWLHHSLAALGGQLRELHLFKGDPRDVLHEVIKRSGATAVYWNRCYEPDAIARDKALMSALRARSIEVKSFNASLLHEPWEIATGSGQPFKVFTPFWRACMARPAAAPVLTPRLTLARCDLNAIDLDGLALLPKKPNWAHGWEEIWTPGERGAHASLDAFIGHGIAAYRECRDRPDTNGTSRLSPHLHWGEISPRQIWARTMLAMEEPSLRAGAEKFLQELGWREFSYHLLYHFPALPDRNWRSEFDAYPWREAANDLKAWQQGRTGYPLVDAGMRELWQTGWMHNRVRMIAASFLVKHLRIDWRRGEEWFWDTLVDADLANNAAGWQWVAGSGADASPYFRIFNPVAQGKKFDPAGRYVRRWCPELSGLPDDMIHEPFNASGQVLTAAGVELGTSYPRPIIDHRQAREAALAGYSKVRAAAKNAASGN